MTAVAMSYTKRKQGPDGKGGDRLGPGGFTDYVSGPGWQGGATQALRSSSATYYLGITTCEGLLSHSRDSAPGGPANLPQTVRPTG